MVKKAAELPLPIDWPEPVRRGALVVGSVKVNDPVGPADPPCGAAPLNPSP